MIRLLPLLAILVLLLGLVSLAHAQETTTDTSSDPGQADDPPVALQQNSPVKLADNTDEVDDEDDGLVVGFVAGDPGATPPSAASYRSYSVSFTTGSDAGWYQLVEVLIATKVTGTPLARLSIHRDHEGSPHAEALYVTHFRGASEEDPDLYLEFPDNTPLNPNQTYWAVFEEVSGLGVYEISTAPNGDEGPDSWPISDTSLQRNFFSLAGRTWQASALNPIAMVVDGYPVEERVLVGAHGLRDTATDGPFLRFGTERVTKGWLKLPKGRTYDGGATNPNIRIDCEPQFVEGPDTETSWRLCSTNKHYDHEWAGGRGFTTGPHPTGYTISGLGADIDAQSGTLDPVADIYAAEAFSSREGARDPQSPLASYQATAGIGGSPDRFAPRTGSERFQAEPGLTYVAYFQNAAAGYYETPNASPGEDLGAEAGWTLGGPYGSRFVHPVGFGGDDWNHDNEFKWIPLNVYGWPNPLPPAPNPAPPPPGPVLVSTLGQPSTSTGQLVGKRINLEIAYAASFTNGNDAVHTLHGVQIEVTVIPPLQVLGAIRASIYSDDGGEPGVALHVLGLRANPQVGVLTFDAPADTTLAANTTFWLVIDIAHSPTEDFFRTAVTSGTGQDACAIRNWSIGDVAYFREGPGAAWSPNADLLKMAVLGERVSGTSAELGEPTCGDLPGDTTTNGRLVVDGDGVKGRHASARDADWYAVSLEAGVDYQFDADPTDPQPRLYLLKIHDDQGTELRSSAIAPVGGPPNWYQHPNRVNSLPFRTDQAGAYYVSIASPKGGRAPDRVYTLSAQSDDHPADTSTTAVAELGELTRVYLMRTSSDPDDTATDDVDWVRASLLANVRYRFVYDVACLHEGIIEGIYDSDGALVPDSGSSIARKTDGTCTDLTMAFTAPGDGDYYVAVTARGSYYPENKRHPFGGVYGTLKVDGTITTSMGQRANSPATGGPGITGTVQAGETLTATTDGIEDEDGLTGAVFASQWVRSDTDIEGAASSTYTMTGDDEGKAIQVRVTFTDDAGNAESLTSYAVLSVPPLIIPDSEPPPKSTATREAREAQGEQEAAETPLTAAIHDAPESHDGQEDFTFELRFSEELGTGFSYKTLRDHAFTVTRGTVAGARRLDGDSDTPNTRWEISVTPDSNADVTVELPVTTDCEAQGAICTEDGTMLSSPLKFAVKGPPLTASFESVPTSHNGSDNFKFRIAFSEEFSLSYLTLRDDHVFTVEGGTVVGARRLVSGSNIRWEVSVSPDSNGDVTIVLPATTDCDAQGAICADGDKKLSNRLERTVSGPGQ